MYLTSPAVRLTTPATNPWLIVLSAVCLRNSSQRMKVIILPVCFNTAFKVVKTKTTV